MIERTEVIYSAQSIEEAHLLTMLLEERGIESVIENDALQGAAGALPLGPTTAPRVRVAADQAAKARQVVSTFEQHQQAARERTSEWSASPQGDLAAWPICPACGRRRQTACPICETAGDEFPLADANYGRASALGAGDRDEVDAPAPVLICNICDEPFAPQYYRRCAWCGHDFGEGRAAAASIGDRDGELLTPQAWAVLIGVLGVGAAVVGYFWWLTRP